MREKRFFVRASVCVFTTLFSILGFLGSSQGATVIGPEARLALPTSAEWSSIVNFRPGNNETVTVNPPPFSWLYQPLNTAGKVDRLIHDGPNRAFRFQCAYSPTFSSPVVDVITSNNCYNFLAPFTPASTVYWRIHYLNHTNLTTNTTSTIRSFTISATATNWDRSMLADEDWWAAKTQHPYMLFNAANRAAMLRFLQTNNGPEWLRITNLAKSAVTQAWWTATEPEHAPSLMLSNTSTIAGLSAPTFLATPLNNFQLRDLAAYTTYHTNHECSNWQALYSIRDSRSLSNGNTLTSGTNTYFYVQFKGQWVRTAAANSDVAVVIGLYDGTNNHVIKTNIYPIATSDTAGYINEYMTNNGPVIAGSKLTATVYALSAQSPTIATLVGPYAGYLWVNGISDNGTWAQGIGNVAFVYALTQDTNWLTYNPQQRLSDFATYYKSRYFDQGDVVSGSPFIKSIYGLAFAYDYLYNDLTTEQRTNIVGALEETAYCWLKKDWWYANLGNANRTWSVGTVVYGSAALQGGAHQNVSYLTAAHCALASWRESSKSREAADYFLNYAIGVAYPYGSEDGWNQGRWYNQDGIANYSGTVVLHSTIAATFPELKFHLNPFWRSADWYMRITPVKWQQNIEPWGDTGEGPLSTWEAPSFKNIALLSQNSEVWLHHLNHRTNALSSLQQPEWWEIALAYYLRAPASATNAVNAKVFPKEGWVTASTHAPNTANAFTNGVTLIFQARPRGSEINHSDFTDGSFQMFAYGAAITDAGDRHYSKHSMQNYSLLVDGYGHAMPHRWPTEKAYSQIIAYTNGANFVYAAADLTRAYARTNFGLTGNASGPYGATVDWSTRYATGPAAHVSLVERHMLFMRGKYLVIYDNLATTRPSIFSWLYHVREDTVSVDEADKSFNYSTKAFYRFPDVVTHVQHILNPALLTLTNMHGADVYKNPITGEDYTLQKRNTGRTNAIWVQNATPTRNWHFMSVIYPQSASMSAPTITRINDYTVAVTNGNEGDVITFNTNYAAQATHVIDLGAISSGSGAVVSTPPRRPATPVIIQQ